MFLKHMAAPEGVKPKQSPVHYGDQFDVWRGEACSAFLLLADGTRKDFPNAYEAIWHAHESLKPETLNLKGQDGQDPVQF